MGKSVAEPEEVEPVNTDVIMGMTFVCIASGLVFVAALILPGIVGSLLTPEMVLAAGMAFAASFLITISLFPENATGGRYGSESESEGNRPKYDK